MTLADLLAACAGVIDVTVDEAARDFDRVLERLRSLDDVAWAKLATTLDHEIEKLAHELRQVELARHAKQQTIDEWRSRRELAVRSDAPTLVEGVELQITSMQAEVESRELEAAEYRAGLEDLQRARALIVRARR